MSLLVPMQLASRQEREADGTCKRTQVRMLAWCQLDARGRPRAPVETAPVLDGSGAALEEATRRLEQSLGPADGLLVSVGPLALRQHLHPAAHQAQAHLSSRFDSYVDLAAEFERRYGRPGAERAEATMAAPAAEPDRWLQADGAPDSGRRRAASPGRQVQASRDEPARDQEAPEPADLDERAQASVLDEMLKCK